MIAHKFLARSAKSPMSRFPWPVPQRGSPGEWVTVEGPLAPCARGIHVCRPVDLAHWVGDELWEIEIDGDRIEGIDCIVVRRARLIREIVAWKGGGAARFSEACIERAEKLVGAVVPLRALVDDARTAASDGHLAISAYCSAVAVARLQDPGNVDASFRGERAWQGEWIARELLAD